MSCRTDGNGPARLPGLEAVERQLEDVIVALRAERQRRAAGSVVKRPVWKNLVFAGGPGTGKSRAAAAVGRAYRELGVLSGGHVDEVAGADLAGSGVGETGALVAEAVRRATGGVLMITAAHAWCGLPDHGQQVLRRLHEKLTEYRSEMRDDLAVILAGQPEPLRELLHASPPLAARFRAVIDFPGYTPAQLAAILGALADEAGLTLTPAARHKAAALLAQAEGDHGPGNARLAVRLLNQVTTAQARRVTIAPPQQASAMLSTVTEADIPQHLDHGDLPAGEDRPGQYL